jgi:hypothetical protein
MSTFHLLVRFIIKGEKSMNVFQTLKAMRELMSRNPRKANPEPTAEPSPSEASPDATGDVGNSDQYAHVPTLPTVGHATLAQYVEDNKTAVYKYVYNSLKKAIREDADEVALLRVGHKNVVMFITKKEYEPTLAQMILHFKKAEEYEMIPRCKRLLEKHYVNQVIRDSKN